MPPVNIGNSSAIERFQTPEGVGFSQNSLKQKKSYSGKPMAATAPLKGLELVDCARANAKQGLETAAHQCGYGSDLTTFKQELKQACDNMGVTFNELSDLVTDQQSMLSLGGEIVAPDSEGKL